MAAAFSDAAAVEHDDLVGHAHRGKAMRDQHDHLVSREATEALGRWVQEGRIRWEVDVQQGFENAPKTLLRVYTGANFGKQLLEL